MPVISGRKMQKLIILTLRTLNTSNYSGVGGYELRHTFFRQTKTEQKTSEIEITVVIQKFLFSISFLLSLFGIGIHSRSLQDDNNFRMFTCHVFLSLILVLTSCIMVALGGWVLYMDQENLRKIDQENNSDGPIYGGGNVPQERLEK